MFLLVIGLLLASAVILWNIGDYLERRQLQHRLHRKQIDTSGVEIGTQLQCLLPPMSADDAQWVRVFRETVEASEGKLSPFLEKLLDPDQVIASRAIAKARAMFEAERADLRRQITVSDAFAWLRSETLKKADAEADKIIADARNIAERIKQQR